MLPEHEVLRRRERLQALVDHPDFGGKAALGRALGYADGAFVGQMLRGERPVTEKTIVQVQSMRGGKFAGWFDVQAPAAPSASPWPFRRITQEAWAAIDAYDQAAVEEVARQKMRELQAEREAGATGKRRTLAA